MNEPVFNGIRPMQYSITNNAVLGDMKCRHYHDGYEIYLHLDGECNVFFSGRGYILQRGSLFIIEPYIMHMTTNSASAVCSRNILNFKRSILEGFLTEKEISSLFKSLKTCIIRLTEEQIAVICRHFTELSDLWCRYSHGGEKHCRKLAYMEVYRLADKIIHLTGSNSDKINPEAIEAAPNTEILRVIEYVEKHYAEDISVHSMVQYSHMSQAAFYRAFKRVTGSSFANYLSRCRLSRAHKLIDETNLPLGEIAARTGFSSTAHMSRIFRQEYGTSPSHCRK